MIEQKLIRLIREALEASADKLGLDKVPDEIELIRPKQKVFGDFSTNVALVLSARVMWHPRQAAEAIVSHMPPADFVTKVEVAGPGFINFHVAHGWLYDVLRQVIEEGSGYGRAEPVDESVQVEFVSANPTGPLHVGHARNAALGDAVANVLEAAGYRVEREYYYNDAGRQMDLFAASVEARYLELSGRPAVLPEDGYAGEYIVDIARDIREEHGDALADLPDQERTERIKEEAVRRMFADIEGTLERFGVRFDTWFSERTLHETGAIRGVVDHLMEAGHAYEAEGAVFFRASEFGDEKDRVLIRRGGEPTYFAADCAYLEEKFGRGFDRLVYVWGADHHGAVKRLLGVARALGFDPAAVEPLIYQLVTLTRGGQPVRVSKRTGDLVTLDELLDEVGPDAARYTLLRQSHDSAIDFDIEEVVRQSLENPVYYVQYAHARIASILRMARDRGIELRPVEEVDLERIHEEAELDLLRAISELPGEIETAAAARAPHRLTRYAENLAAAFHRFYTECRVLSDDPGLTQARLWLSWATRQAVANVLGLLGVSAPESMERADA